MPDDLREEVRAEILKEYGPLIDKGKTLDQIDADPKFRRSLRTLVAEKFPEAAPMMPETAVAAAVAPTLEALNKERELLAATNARNAQLLERAAFRQQLRQAGVGESDLGLAEELAQKRQTLDPQALAYLVKEAKTVAAPTAGWGRPALPGHGKHTGDYWSGKLTGSPSIVEDPSAWAEARAQKDWYAIEHRLPLDPIDV